MIQLESGAVLGSVDGLIDSERSMVPQVAAAGAPRVVAVMPLLRVRP